MNRKSILKNLIQLDRPLDTIQNELIKYGWDSDELIILKKYDLKLILEKYLEGLISNDSLDLWANIIEGRDDIGFDKIDDKVINEVIFILANPDISMRLTKENVKKLIEKLV